MNLKASQMPKHCTVDNTQKQNFTPLESCPRGNYFIFHKVNSRNSALSDENVVVKVNNG